MAGCPTTRTGKLQGSGDACLGMGCCAPAWSDKTLRAPRPFWLKVPNLDNCIERPVKTVRSTRALLPLHYRSCMVAELIVY